MKLLFYGNNVRSLVILMLLLLEKIEFEWKKGRILYYFIWLEYVFKKTFVQILNFAKIRVTCLAFPPLIWFDLLLIIREVLCDLNSETFTYICTILYYYGKLNRLYLSYLTCIS